ncbi:hypothetical protein [Mycobacterium interjectum]|uniref:hypothetical protein n=1 Tax=Mycobacterium interjectum TaxID=33895 RepID=UPI00082A04CD|nr:hypothetical protein [Mycobacterium interjectum]MCV7088760.1 hypothetical protein [Mycobacterium interjectum]
MYSAAWRPHWPQRRAPAIVYQLTDCLHDGHTARVAAAEIPATVSAWLDELGAHSPLVDDLERAVRGGDWAGACAIGDRLSVRVAVAS